LTKRRKSYPSRDYNKEGEQKPGNLGGEHYDFCQTIVRHLANKYFSGIDEKEEEEEEEDSLQSGIQGGEQKSSGVEEGID
jgi:hypothetical protein